MIHHIKKACLILLLMLSYESRSQEVSSKLTEAFNRMSTDQQFKYSILSLYVEDSKTGEVVFKKNEQIGLAPASCLKVITSVTAIELLGINYTYKTPVYTTGKISNGNLDGDVFLKASGDPTFGSFRYKSHPENLVFEAIADAVKAKGIKKINGFVYVDQSNWEQDIPGGWTWRDIGNYYGAAAHGFNWRENQYDLKLASGTKIGDPVKIVQVLPKLYDLEFKSELTSAGKGTGDQAYIYLPLRNDVAYVRGTIPIEESRFSISGSIFNPAHQFANAFYRVFHNDQAPSKLKATSELPSGAMKITEYTSPILDSINYWFMKKSVNLYGEAFVKTIGFVKSGKGSTEAGLKILRDFWKDKGIEPAALRVIDGSGLSPENRVTTHALVKVLAYAKTRSWFNSFEHSLPVINEIKMKSGSISGVIAYSGYVKSKVGRECTFSFIVNNFNGSSSGAREKVFRVLDVMK